MDLHLIRTVEKWKEISHEWDDLVGKSLEHFNPFLSFQWLFSWWKVFGKGKKLRILIANKDGELVAIAPLMISRNMGFRICEFIGTGRSDYLGFILKQKNREEILIEFFKFISNNLKWDLLYLRDYIDPPEELLRIAKAQGMQATSIRGDVAPRLIMKGSWEEYLAGKSRKHRGNIKRLIKHIETDENITIECIRNYSPTLVDELAAVEAKSWKVEQGDPRFSGSGKDFYKALFQSFAKNDWLEIWTLRYQENLLAYNINFVLGKATYFYNVSFDKDYRQYTKHSVGSAITAFALRASFERNHKIYDFLRGDEPYKQLWTNDSKDLMYIASYKRGPFSFLAFIINFKLRLFLRESGLAMNLVHLLRKRIEPPC